MAVDEVTLEIATPKGLFNGSFPKTTKISEVISTVVSSLGLDGRDALELVNNGSVLQPTERPLVSFGLAGTVQLDLVATGSGV
ncbi:MAG: hypothetical protein CMQ43_01560 [Gammaproteobacteria bacterium]|nr:hypothetical protein [Gammaproteobacteria bacterium]|tara:strand:+ start:2468 stop:2716 length:249 start_codon:yes stop_codon:yes gene_type:complete